MATDSLKHSRYSARLLLLLLVTVPVLPEVVILAVATFSGLMGCLQDQNVACPVGSPAAVVNWALWAGGVDIVKSAVWRAYFYLAVGAWLVICYVVLILGWARVSSRLVLGSAVALFFALLPFCAPLLAIKTFADNRLCKPESTGCKLFGEEVDKAYAALEMAKLPFNDWAAVVMFGIFAVFATLVIASGAVSTRRPIKS
jgi:hypothetical protein